MHQPRHTDSDLPAPLAKILDLYNRDDSQLKLHFAFVALVMIFWIAVVAVMN